MANLKLPQRFSSRMDLTMLQRRWRERPTRSHPPRVERKGIRPSHIRPRGRADPRLIVKEAVAKSKHQTYYELVENTEKKKKLEFTVRRRTPKIWDSTDISFQITSNRNPPPGFTFVPVGNPELTQLCKEISREQDCMIFVVSVGSTHFTILLVHMANDIHRPPGNATQTYMSICIA